MVRSIPLTWTTPFAPTTENCCCVFSAGTTHFRHRDEREGEAGELGAASPRRSGVIRGEPDPRVERRSLTPASEARKAHRCPRGEGHAKWRGALEVSQFAAGG